MDGGAFSLADNDGTPGKVEVSHVEAMHLVELTAEEKVLEKKLVRKLDRRIMPLVIMVYLMNYIDR